MEQDKNIKTYRKKLVLTMFACMAIMGLDRSSLGIAAPIMMTELGIEPGKMGILLSAFFWSYTLFNLPAGGLADRFGSKKVLGWAGVIWSVASAATGLMSSLAGFIVARIGVGLGEAGVFPTMAKIAAEHFPDRERATATGCYLAGARLGYALTPIVMGFLISQYSWRDAFYITGLGSLAFCVFWFLWYNEKKGVLEDVVLSRPAEAQKTIRIPWRKLFSNRNILGLFIAKFGANYLYFMFLTWVPSYLVMERGFSVLKMGIFASLPFIVAFVTQPLTGYISDFVVRRGLGLTIARKGVLVVAQLLSATIIAAAYVEEPLVAVAILTINIAAASTIGGMMQTIASEISPRGMAGTVTGAMNAVGAVAGALAPAITGYIVELTGTFQYALTLAGGLIAFSACIILFVIQKIEPIRLD